jgi:hypothetical protein
MTACSLPAIVNFSFVFAVASTDEVKHPKHTDSLKNIQIPFCSVSLGTILFLLMKIMIGVSDFIARIFTSALSESHHFLPQFNTISAQSSMNPTMEANRLSNCDQAQRFNLCQERVIETLQGFIIHKNHPRAYGDVVWTEMI